MHFLVRFLVAWKRVASRLVLLPGRPFSLKQALLCATCSGAFRTLLVFRRSPLAPTQAAIGPHQAEINPNRGHILFIYIYIYLYMLY